MSAFLGWLFVALVALFFILLASGLDGTVPDDEDVAE